MDCNPPGFSVHGILQARILEWLAIPFFRGSSLTRESNTGLLHCRQILQCLSHQGSAALELGTHNSPWSTVPTQLPLEAFVLIQFSSVQSLSRVWLFETPWIAARQASLSITNSQNLLKLMSIESVMPSSHLILCRPLLLLPPIPPSIRVFSNESALCMRWPKYWSFNFSISPSNEHPGLISFRVAWVLLTPDLNLIGQKITT